MLSRVAAGSRRRLYSSQWEAFCSVGGLWEGDCPEVSCKYSKSNFREGVSRIKHSIKSCGSQHEYKSSPITPPFCTFNHSQHEPNTKTQSQTHRLEPDTHQQTCTLPSSSPLSPWQPLFSPSLPWRLALARPAPTRKDRLVGHSVKIS